jgi:hypothetical protein
VRSTDPQLTADLRRVLPAHVDLEVEAPHHLSIQAGAESGRMRGFHFLYRGSAVVLRTRSRGRLLRAIIAHLDGFDADPDGSVRLNARLLTDGRRAVVIDAGLGSIVDRIERRLEPLGYRSIDRAGVVVDRTTLEVLTWPPRLEFDRDALAAIERDDDAPDDREPAVDAGRLPIRTLVLRRRDEEEDTAPSQLLLKLMGLVVSPDRRRVSGDMVLAQRLMETGGVRVCDAHDTALLEALGDGAKP